MINIEDNSPIVCSICGHDPMVCDCDAELGGWSWNLCSLNEYRRRQSLRKACRETPSPASPMPSS
jgi:hypothetical protein